MVPVPAQVRCLAWHHHQVAAPDHDLLVAPRAQIGLPGLVGLDPANIVAWGVLRHPASILPAAHDEAEGRTMAAWQNLGHAGPKQGRGTLAGAPLLPR